MIKPEKEVIDSTALLASLATAMRDVRFLIDESVSQEEARMICEGVAMNVHSFIFDTNDLMDATRAYLKVMNSEFLNPALFPYDDFAFILPQVNAVNAGKIDIVFRCFVGQESITVFQYALVDGTWHIQPNFGFRNDQWKIPDSEIPSLLSIISFCAACQVYSDARMIDVAGMMHHQTRRYNNKSRKEAPIPRPHFITIDRSKPVAALQAASIAGGAQKAPHDRRSHTRTLLSGKVIIVKASKIRGGALGPQEYQIQAHPSLIDRHHYESRRTFCTTER